MSELLHALLQKEKEYQKYADIIRTRQDIPAEGSLRIDYSGKCEYYLRTNPSDPRGKYISKKNLALIHALAQKGYDNSLLPLLEKRLKEFNHLISSYSPDEIQKTYSSLRPERQALIKPVIEPDEIFLQKWLNQEYVRLSFSEGSPEIYSVKGERVRSKSEKMIADALFAAGIPYLYELPFTFRNGLTVHPDFTILLLRTRELRYWEHLGMMDDPDYAANAVRKINDYAKNNILVGKQLLITQETSRVPVSTILIEKMIRELLV